MDNFDLHAYLRNNPLLEKRNEDKKETKTKMTKEKFKKMVKEMALNEMEMGNPTPELPVSTLTKLNSFIKDTPTLAQTLLDIFTAIQSKEQIDFSKNSMFKTVLNYLQKIADPVTKSATKTEVNEEEIDEMARIATYYELTDDYEEAISKMPENKQKSSRYQRVINYLKDNGQGTLKTIADEEFRTSETAAVSPIMSDLVSYGVAQKGDLVSPKQEKPVGDGTRGRKMSDVGRVKSALEKFKAGSSDYTDEERTALQNFIDSISATLKEGLNEAENEGISKAIKETVAVLKQEGIPFTMVSEAEAEDELDRGVGLDGDHGRKDIIKLEGRKGNVYIMEFGYGRISIDAVDIDTNYPEYWEGYGEDEWTTFSGEEMVNMLKKYFI
jgi:hypothetical protein